MTKILVAEDERDIRELIAFTLRYAGYQVSTAANGEVALAMARQEIPDLIIMDVRMPRMTGYDACREIKAGASTQHIPVVFLSAKGQEAEIQNGLDVGAQEYILKPFSPEQLTEVVREILSRNRQQSAQK